MILVTGSTGNNGTQIVRQLATQGVPVRGLVRNLVKEAARVAEMKALGIEVAEGDLSKPESLSLPLNGVTAALLLSPVNPNTVELQGNFIRAAQQAGVSHIVKFSMIGAAADSPVPLSRWHREAEIILERSCLQWTHLRPNDLMRYNTRLLMPSIQKEGAFYDSLGQARISMVDEEDVAEVAAKVLTSRGHEGKTYVLTGPESLSFADIAGYLAASLNRSVRYVDITPEQAEKAMLAGGLPEPAVKLVGALRAYERENHNAILTTTVRDLLGRSPKPYRVVAAELAKTWNSQLAAVPAN